MAYPIRGGGGEGCLQATVGFEIQMKHNGRPRERLSWKISESKALESRFVCISVTRGLKRHQIQAKNRKEEDRKKQIVPQ